MDRAISLHAHSLMNILIYFFLAARKLLAIWVAWHGTRSGLRGQNKLVDLLHLLSQTADLVVVAAVC